MREFKNFAELSKTHTDEVQKLIKYFFSFEELERYIKENNVNPTDLKPLGNCAFIEYDKEEELDKLVHKQYDELNKFIENFDNLVDACETEYRKNKSSLFFNAIKDHPRFNEAMTKVKEKYNG